MNNVCFDTCSRGTFIASEHDRFCIESPSRLKRPLFKGELELYFLTFIAPFIISTKQLFRRVTRQHGLIEGLDPVPMLCVMGSDPSQPHYDSVVARGLLWGTLDGDGIWIKSQPSLPLPFRPHVARYK